MSEFDIGGVHYGCAPLPTETQWYVYRRLMPVLQGLAPLFTMAAFVRGADGAVRPDLARIPIMDAIAALFNAFGNLSDADTDYIKGACLDSVRWQQGTQWMPLRAPGGVFLQGHADRFDVQLRLVWEVLRSSFENFSPEIAFPFLEQTSNGFDQTSTPAQTAVMTP